MDSRTKFYGPVLAMLALSAVAFSGFITPQIESEEPEERQEDVLPASESPDSEAVENSESPSISDSETSNGEDSADTPLVGEPLPDDPPSEPVSLLDWLFIPIPEESPSRPSPTGSSQSNVAE